MVQILEAPGGFSSQLGQRLGAGLVKGVEFGEKVRMEKHKQKYAQGQKDKMADLLVKRGVDPEDAKLYAELTTGGQTEFAKNILESRKRGLDSFGNKATRSVNKIPAHEKDEMMQQEGMQEPERSPEQEVEEELGAYQEFANEGLTPAEKVKRESERYKTNLPVYQEAGTRLRGLTRDKERLSILESLDKTGKLPKNLGRVNVDEDGNLKFAFASAPEAQRYVKTLNEFSANAKDTFGSRVTNFDLQQYLLRFPNLLNSAEGRNQIYKQMKIVNEINSVYYKNLKDVYDRSGGIRNIDPDIAEKLADKLSESKVEGLVKKFDDIGTFPTLPDASAHKGKKIRDTKTNEVLQSDGTNWLPVK